MGVSICGTVVDESGKPLEGVKVLALHEPTGSLFAQFTDDNGSYRFENIKAGGPYALTASQDGFVTVEEKGFKLKTEEMHELNFNLVAAERVGD